MLKKKMWAKFQRIIELLTQKIFTKLSKIWVWDPRSGIWKKSIPDSRSRGQKGTGSRIRIRNTGIALEPLSMPNRVQWFSQLDEIHQQKDAK